MKRLSIVMLLILCTGCAFNPRFPLYKDYQRVKVGFPVPTDIKNNTDWGGVHDPNASKVYGIREYAEYQLANDGNVVAKWYDCNTMEVSLLILLAAGRHTSECEFLLSLNPAVVYNDSDIRKEIQKKYIEIRGETFIKRDLEPLLKLAMDKGGLANEKFHLRKFEIDKIFPAIESSLWRISRTSSGSYYLFMERRNFLSFLAAPFL